MSIKIDQKEQEQTLHSAINSSTNMLVQLIDSGVITDKDFYSMSNQDLFQYIVLFSKEHDPDIKYVDWIEHRIKDEQFGYPNFIKVILAREFNSRFAPLFINDNNNQVISNCLRFTDEPYIQKQIINRITSKDSQIKINSDIYNVLACSKYNADILLYLIEHIKSITKRFKKGSGNVNSVDNVGVFELCKSLVNGLSDKKDELDLDYRGFNEKTKEYIRSVLSQSEITKTARSVNIIKKINKMMNNKTKEVIDDEYQY